MNSSIEGREKWRFSARIMDYRRHVLGYGTWKF
ncbi:hypothetical protein BJ992_005287 [Sphaerisporangium rubeum]|uniref:Uncharacterized protein n=1 Tax=Sphaerisporangium rubeum TaxID=321317 RepID=A0A7X0IIH7_9ACTN|nr:hypothetical protein [Sphaerisporangium rubeum]